MKNNRKLLLIFLTVLLGLISGFFSYCLYPYLGFFSDYSPGICFGISICLMLYFFVKARINISECIVFIIGSALSYYIAQYIVTSGAELHPSLFRVAFAGLVGGVGVCISYTIFNYKFLGENIVLILVSAITSLALILDISTYVFHDKVLVLFMLWQGAMIGCFTFFTINKIQKDIKVEENLMNNHLSQ